MTLLTTKDAARHIGLSASTLAQWRIAGKGPTFAKLGARVVYRSEDLDRWVEDNLVTGGA